MATLLPEDHVTGLHLCPREGLLQALLTKVPTSALWHLHLLLKPGSGSSIRPYRKEKCISLLSQGISERTVTWDHVFCFLLCLTWSRAQSCPGYPPSCQAPGCVHYAARVFSNHKQWALHKMPVPPQGSSCLPIHVIRESKGGAHQLFEEVNVFRIEKSKCSKHW